MKVQALLVLALLPLSAHAVVVDNFKCTLEVVDATTQAVTQVESTLTGARMPNLDHSLQLPEGVVSTQSEIESSLFLTMGEKLVRITPHLSYQHAYPIDPTGQIHDGRMSGCSWVEFSVCSPGAPHNSCSGSQIRCLFNRAPYDSPRGWAAVPMISGVPGMSGLQFGDESGTIRDTNIYIPFPGGPTPPPISDNPLGTYRFACQYLSTVH